jgi:hydroxyacylglutathione hydrolase
MSIPLEDNVSDIIGKAQRGLGISDSQLATRSGVVAEKLQDLQRGHLDEDVLTRVAPVLRLDSNSLRKLGRGEWEPEPLGEMEGLRQFNTVYYDMTVNAYLIWDPTSSGAVVFDTGADCRGIMQCVEKNRLHVQLILLTHAHPDHVADLPRLRKTTGAPIYISTFEVADGAEGISEGKQFRVGSLEIESRLTSGHSPGGMTYVVTGLSRPVAVVGDSLFAASMGGGNISYEDALRNNREKILTLPDETIVCPGHGPLTTVGKEKRENPFFGNV